MIGRVLCLLLNQLLLLPIVDYAYKETQPSIFITINHLKKNGDLRFTFRKRSAIPITVVFLLTTKKY